jgi:erythromycin esterase-like protein
MSITQQQRRSAIALAAAIIGGATVGVAVPPLSTQAAVAGEPAVAWIDLRPLRGIVRGARIVGLGEPSHGAHEQVTLRHRAVRAANVHTTAIPRVTWTFPSDNVTFTNKVMAGGHLRLRYGRSYVSIGTVSRTGRIRGGFETGQPSVFTVPPPRPPTVDHVLGQARHRTYLLDLRAPASPPVRRWLDAPATMRLIGSAYDAGKDADFTMTVGSLRRGFDAVLHIGAVTPTRPLDQ